MIRFPGVAAFSRRPFVLAGGPGTLWAGDTGFVIARDESTSKSHWPGWVWEGEWRNAGYTGDPQVPGDRDLDIIDIGQPQHGTASRAGRSFTYWVTDPDATSDEFTYTIRDRQGQEATGTVYVSIVPTKADAVITYGSHPDDIYGYPHANLDIAKLALPDGGGTIRVSYGSYLDRITVNAHADYELTLQGVRGPEDQRPYFTATGVLVSLQHLKKMTISGLEVSNCSQWISPSVPNHLPGYTLRVEDCHMHHATNNGIHGNHYDQIIELIDSEFSHAGQGNTKHIFYALGKWLYIKGCVFHSARGSEMLKNRFRTFLVEDTVFEATRENDPESTVWICSDMTNHHSARGLYRRCEFIIYPRNDGTRGNSGIFQRDALVGPLHNTINPDYHPMHGSPDTFSHPHDQAYAAFPVAETDPRYSWPDGDPGASAFWQDDFWNAVVAAGFSGADENPYLYQVYHEECTWRVRGDVIPDQHSWARAVDAQGQQPLWRPAQFRGDLSFPVDRPMGWVPRIKMYFANCSFLNYLDPSQHLFNDWGTISYGFKTPADCVGPYTEGVDTYGLLGHEPKYNTNQPDPFQLTCPFAKPGEPAPSGGWGDIVGPTFDFSAGGNNDDRDPTDPQAFFGNNNSPVNLPYWWGFNHTNSAEDYKLFPQIVSATVVDSDTIRLTWGTKDLDTAGPNTASDYTYTINGGTPATVGSVSTDSTTQVTLGGLETAIQSGDVVLVSFSGQSTQNALRGTNFNRAKPFSSWSVSNTL